MYKGSFIANKEQATSEAQADASGNFKKPFPLPTHENNLPNIVFLLADDLGYGDIGYNGGAISTPNIDELASSQHSIKFNRFYSGSPVCSPTRGTLLTGRNHNRYCIWKANTVGKNCTLHHDFLCPTQHPLPPSEVTVAEILKEQGYQTAVFGKWHLGDLKHLSHGHSRWSPSNPSQNGFDVWKVTERSVPTSTPNCGCFNVTQCALGHYRRQGAPPCTNYHSMASNNSGIVVDHDELINKDDSEFIVDEFETFLDDTLAHSHASARQPFFAYIPFHAVHKRYVAFPPYDALFTRTLDKFSTKEIDYYSTITALDTAVGRVRRLLKHYNLSENTMIWFSSDNGPENKTPGSTGGLKGRKGTLYEGGIRVPGIIEWPTLIRNNRVTDYPVVTNDFLPTVCDIVGVQPPTDRELDGISILPHLKGKVNRRQHMIMWAFSVKGNFDGKYTVAALHRDMKLIVEYKQGQAASSYLYNVTSACSEDCDLSELNPRKHKRMLREAETWRLSVKYSAESEVKCLPT